MNILNELSKKNTYQPNLSSSQESCERTYRQAIRKLDKNMTYYNGLDLSKLTPEEIYDICNEAAADLALCCELFLKAIYIYEHGIKGENIDTMWENLSRPDVKDANGNKMYINNGVIAYIKVDANGQRILDANGQVTLADINGNPISYNAKGSVIKKNGHDLEYLIESVISPEARRLLEIIMTTNLMEETERHKSIDLVDILASKGALEETKKISETQYKGWLEQHAQTFIDSRYAGQAYHNIEVAFLYHLAIQCKALAQYIIEPSKKQQVQLTNQEEENIPDIIKKISIKYKKLVSAGLIKLTIVDEKIRKKLEAIFDSGIIGLFAQIKPQYFLAVVQYFSIDEIAVVCKIIASYYQDDSNKKMIYSFSKLNPNEFINICIYLKQANYKITEEIFNTLLDAIMANNYEKKIYNNDYEIDNNLINNKKYK